MKLIIGVLLVLLTGLSDSQNTCNQGCVIKKLETVQIEQKVIYNPCSYKEESITVSDCKFNNFSINNVVVFTMKYKKFLNLTLSVENRQKESPPDEFYVELRNSRKLNSDCFQLSFSAKDPSLTSTSKEITFHCSEVNNVTDRNNQEMGNPSVQYSFCSTPSTEPVKQQLLFNPNERILKIPKFCEFNDDSCKMIFKLKEKHLITIPTTEDQYLAFPQSVNGLVYQNFCPFEEEPFNLTELKTFSENSKSHCIFVFPSELKFSVQATPERKKILVSFPTNLCSDFTVALFTTSSQDCSDSKNIIFQNKTTIIQNPTFQYSATFTDLHPGNYCVRVSANLVEYQNSAASSSSLLTIPSGESEAEIIEKQPDDSKLPWIIISVIAAILVIVLMIIFYVHRNQNNRELSVHEFEENPLLDVEKKLEDIKTNSHKKILLLRCNEDQKTNTDIENLISFLENCCYCQVLHSKTVTAHIRIVETSPVDWLSDVMFTTSKTLVIVTEKAYNVYNPEKFKVIKDDPNSCLFSDRTFAVGVQMLKHNGNIKSIFARFCYAKDKPLNELTDEIIEIPQALVHLFHCIHNQKSLLCKEEDLIGYWMQDKSFRYLYNLRNDVYQRKNSSETPLIQFPSSNGILKQNTPNSSRTADSNHVLVDFQRNNINAKQKLTNQNHKHHLPSTEISTIQYDSGFNE